MLRRSSTRCSEPMAGVAHGATPSMTSSTTIRRCTRSWASRAVRPKWSLAASKDASSRSSPATWSILPAGTGHRLIEASRDFLVVGAYPENGTYDECTDTRDRPDAIKRIAKVRKPSRDPVYGSSGPLTQLWRKAARPHDHAEARTHGVHTPGRNLESADHHKSQRQYATSGFEVST